MGDMKPPVNEFEEEPVKDGYVRVYIDHTGRWYKDYTQEEFDKIINHPFSVLLREEIQKEINREIIEMLKPSASKKNDIKT